MVTTTKPDRNESRLAALKRAQEMLKQVRPTGDSTVDTLLAGRSKEASKENPKLIR